MISNILSLHSYKIKLTTIFSPCLFPVPCIPTDVAVKLDCSTDQAVVSWSASKGALLYNVTALSTQGEISHCETSNQLCTLTKLVCGQSYSVQVVASDNICSSLPSPATHFKTGRTTAQTLISLGCPNIWTRS